MTQSIYSVLHSRFGSPLTEPERLEACAPKRAALFDARLLPSALSGDALAASDVIPSLRVGVVGARFAGLTAAWYLQQCGVTVAVFESADHIGGRVRTDRDFIAGKTVEAGAELIGVNHAMWFSHWPTCSGSR